MAPDHIVSTTLYDGQLPGPLLRFREGLRVVVDVYNDTDTPELACAEEHRPPRLEEAGVVRLFFIDGARAVSDWSTTRQQKV